MKIVFLDIDGVLLPGRSWVTRPIMGRVFDPIAVAMVEHLLHDGPAKLVMSSSWRKGRDRAGMLAEMKTLGLDLENDELHEDWATPEIYGNHLFSPPPFLSTRAVEIAAWLRAHPEVTHYAALDDDDVMGLPGGVQCTFEDGLQLRHYKQALRLLGIAQGRAEAFPC